jgi:hydrogenase maturation protein HypF
VEALAQGEIVAIKGIGGYHLACDASNEKAVQRLRKGKSRLVKPFAVMVRSLETAAELAETDGEAAALLSDPARPIVVLPSRHRLPESVAPGARTIGLMLPYTPLHYLLMKDERLPCLVMTSANQGGLPLVADREEAESRLASLTDLFVHHDRAIEARCDDSVVRVQGGRTIPVRRSRGYAPFPVDLSFETPVSLAVGAQMKSTFALARGRDVFLSPHLGDLENLETLDYFQKTLQHLKNLYGIEPEIIFKDLHPGYLSGRWAERQGLPIVGVQHHHAHLASCMAEHGLGLECRALGVILDGTGYGTDGTIWGGEILRGGYADFERMAFLKPVPLPGGDKAVQEPWRMALSHLWAAGIPWDLKLAPVRFAQNHQDVLKTQLEKGLNTVATSSVGRLFDAVAALIGLRQVVEFEGQAAMELESIATPGESLSYPVGAQLDPAPMIEAVVRDLGGGVPLGAVSMRFHRGLAAAFVAEVMAIHQGEPVVLSGGVFQNALLLELVVSALGSAGIETLVHRLVPPNDGGISLGQVAVGSVRCQKEGGSYVLGRAR